MERFCVACDKCLTFGSLLHMVYRVYDKFLLIHGHENTVYMYR